MVFLASQLSAEEEEIRRILISIICLYGSEGLPLEWVDQEFFKSCGFPIPYQKFGAESLKTWLITLPNVYIVKDLDGNEVLVEYSPKSQHIKDMVLKQRNGHRPPINRKNSECNNLRSYKTKRRLNSKNLPEGSFIHTSINNASTIDMDRYEKFEELESMLPLFYKHQALGDDFFLDIADMKLGYYVPERGPKTCGLCSSGQTITALTEKVRIAAHLAPRVVVMIGFQDLLLGHNIHTMISDLRELIIELKKKNTRVTLITLIPSPKMPKNPWYKTRQDIYNRALLDYAMDPVLKCNVIDMDTIFRKEAQTFKQNFGRWYKISKNDPYQVFSDYGRKTFLKALKLCLKEQIEYGH